MPMLDEQFEEWAKQDIRLRPPRRIRKAVAHDAFLAGAAAEREAGKVDVAAIRLIGASQPDSSYQEGFADACDNVIHRIRQRATAFPNALARIGELIEERNAVIDKLAECEQQKERLREKLRHETATTRKFAAEFEEKLAKLAGERPEKA